MIVFGVLRIEHTKFVRAPKRKVYEWWTYFQETDPSLSGMIIRNRRIVSRSSNEVIYEDEGNMLRVPYKDTVRVLLYPYDKWVAEYSSSKFDAKSVYTLKDVDEGTEMHVVTEISFKGWIRSFGGIAKWSIKRTIEKEWNDYIKLVEETYYRPL